MYVNKLKVTKKHIYKSATTSAGNTVVDKINSKRVIEVGIIPLDANAMVQLQLALEAFSVNVSFQNPLTNVLEENIKCIIPDNAVEYYTIRADKVMYKAFSFKIEEL